MLQVSGQAECRSQMSEIIRAEGHRIEGVKDRHHRAFARTLSCFTDDGVESIRSKDDESCFRRPAQLQFSLGGRQTATSKSTRGSADVKKKTSTAVVSPKTTDVPLVNSTAKVDEVVVPPKAPIESVYHVDVAGEKSSALCVDGEEFSTISLDSHERGEDEDEEELTASWEVGTESMPSELCLGEK